MKLGLLGVAMVAASGCANIVAHAEQTRVTRYVERVRDDGHDVEQHSDVHETTTRAREDLPPGTVIALSSVFTLLALITFAAAAGE